MFVLAIIVWVVAVIVLIVGLALKSGWTIGGSVFLGVLGFVFMLFSMSYTVDIGEAKVLKSWSGVVNPEPIVTPGWHWKSPTEDAIDFDIRNQLAVFLGDGNQQYNGSPTNGPQITFADKDGVTGNMDLVVLYSIKADSVVGLVENYANQDDFRTKVIEQDIRSVPRDVPGTYSTIKMLTDRVAVAGDIRKALEAEWESKGIVIEDVSLQEVRYPKEIQDRFLAAQNAQTAVVEAEAAAQKAKIDADSKAYVTKTEAQAQADANNLLAASLSPQILQQRWIDAVAGAGTIIVPQDFTALGNLAPQ